MNRVYEFIQNLNGEPTVDIVMLFSPTECDFDEVLHRIGLKLCMSPQGKKLCNGSSELTFGALMGCLTPEMLKPYGVTMRRLREGAQQVDGAAPVVSRREMELYQDLCKKHTRQLCDIREYGERIAKRLEYQRTHGHPAISTWDPTIITGKAVVWAYLYATGNERDFKTFFERKLSEAKPHIVTGVNPMVGTDAVSDYPEEQQANKVFQ